MTKYTMENNSNEITLTTEEPKVILDAEFCFQFDDGEPHVFAWSSAPTKEGEKPAEVTINLQANTNCSISFHKDGKVFKIFAREISPETKILRGDRNDA